MARPTQQSHRGNASSRDPAAIRPSFDFSLMEGTKLLAATKERLIAGARVLKKKGQIGLELGHFVLRGKSGQKIFGCEEYTHVQLVFEGDGTIIDGKKPSLSIESPCSISKSDINRIEPIWIPVLKILASELSEQSFQLEENETHYQFTDVYDQWPTQWLLKEVRMIKAGAAELRLSQEEIYQFSEEGHLIDFSLIR